VVLFQKAVLPEESPASIGQGARQDWRRKFASQGEEVASARCWGNFGKCHRNHTAVGRSGTAASLPAAAVFAFPGGKGEMVG